jgi:ribosome-associated translation inhibitor RaiA
VTDAADTATVARLRKRIRKLKRKLKHYRKLEAAKAPPISELDREQHDLGEGRQI